MEIYLADISPGILGIIIWSLISYFINKSKNKKKNLDKNDYLENNNPVTKDSNSFHFDSILDPQNSFSFDDLYDEKIIESELLEDENVHEDPIQDINVITNSDSIIIDENQGSRNIEPINKTCIKTTYLDQLKSSKSLKNSFIVKEILDKPISIRND